MDAARERVAEFLNGYLTERYGSDAITRMDAIPAGNPDAILREWLRSTSQIAAEPRDGPDGVSGPRTDHQILTDAHKASGCTGEPIVTYSGAKSNITEFRCVPGCPLSEYVKTGPHKHSTVWWGILCGARSPAQAPEINRITNHLAEHCRDKECPAHT